MGSDALRADLGARGWAEDDPLREEAALVGRAKGDRDAFALLYARYAERVHRYCFRILGDREAAEDAAAQTFAKALATIGRCRDDRFRAWLFTIARNVALDELRRRPTETLERAAPLPDLRPSTEDAAEAREGEGRVRALLAQLTEGQRRIVELRLAGLTGIEIAQVLGKSHVAVRVTQMRAYERLRRIVNESEHEEEGRP